MELRALVREDDAVSSVLGVVLMVAVTIILAAVVGTFVLGIGQDLTDESPGVNWEYSMDVNDTTENSTVMIIHSHGDAVDRDQVEVTIDGTPAYENGNSSAPFSIRNGQNWPERITASDRLYLDDGDSTEIQSGDMLRIIWTADSGDTAAIIGERRLG